MLPENIYFKSLQFLQVLLELHLIFRKADIHKVQTHLQNRTAGGKTFLREKRHRW